MISSNLPGDQGSRSQSPFKTRFVNQLGQEPRPDLSPFKPIRQGDSPNRGSIRDQSNKIKNLTEMLLFLFRLLNFLGETDIEGASFMRLILFRHRSHL